MCRSPASAISPPCSPRTSTPPSCWGSSAYSPPWRLHSTLSCGAPKPTSPGGAPNERIRGNHVSQAAIDGRGRLWLASLHHDVAATFLRHETDRQHGRRLGG